MDRFEGKSEPVKSGVELRCERRDVAHDSVRRLNLAFEHLGLSVPEMPQVGVRFVASEKGRLELGRTHVTERAIELLYDNAFATEDGERGLMEKLKAEDIEYPGMTQTLTHELGHISL